MSGLNELGRQALPFLPSALAALVGLFSLWALGRGLSARSGRDRDSRLSRQILLGTVTLATALVVTLLLPLEEATRGQVLSFLGIVLSAAIALSSTSFIGNAMAGIMLRLERDFGTGDFLSIAGHFGRVIERGLLHTEIQNEDRDRVILPNLRLITEPVTVMHRDGTIVSATVSLGYDVPRDTAERLLVEAAGQAELADPFVQIRELGDFSVLYRVAGLLAEPKRVLSARSELRRCMLDVLHGSGVEIVSPNFMNQRVLDPAQRFVPEPGSSERSAPRPNAGLVEKIIFDKAEEAESLEQLESLRLRVLEELETARSGPGDTESGAPGDHDARVAGLESRLETLDALIARRKKEAGEGERDA